jgi:hypothetical protein
MGRYITTTGTAGVTAVEVSGNHSASVNERILANTSSSAFTITLPASSTLMLNDTIEIIDVASNAGNNAITVARNGANIQGLAENLTIDVNGAITTLIYVGSTYGWIVGSV